MENINVIPISDLLKRRRPISGAFSLLHSQPSTTFPQLFDDFKTLNPNSISNTKILNSIPKPSIIIGTLSLPIINNNNNNNNSLSSNSSSHYSCFSFSDDSGSLCCDVLWFDFRMIRSKIRVIAWNFVPFKQCGGLLEIIEWEFVEGFDFGNVECFRLRFDDDNDVEFEKNGDKKAKYCVYGVLSSVSPVSSFKEGVSNTSLSNFVVEVLVCECSLCRSLDCLKIGDGDDLVLGGNVHNFCIVKYVYCCGVSLSWYPVFVKLVGSVVLLEGLRKKVVYIGKEEAQLMFVSNERTCLRVLGADKKGDYLFQKGKGIMIGKGELGMYVGVVRGIYMQGMVVELDEEVWLLLTDELLFLPHSVRVGSIISVRNVHMVSPKFKWAKMLILGACCKTKISTISFSPLEIGCQPMLRSSSLLGKFLESMVFPARLWLLLLVQCFKKKYSGVYSEREILGTKHTEGMVQTYARFILPSSVFQSRHGNFMEFCKHKLCGSGSNICYGSLTLAMPFSNVLKHCERMCVKSILQDRNGLAILQGCSQVGPVRENRSSDQIIRKILPCKDIGVSLLGNLKFCPTTGRLQYIDATGSIDAVIPDIPSTWNVNAVYEVFNYNIVSEGTPETFGQAWRLEDALFSCSNLFKAIKINRQAELTVYIQFSWSNVFLRHLAICPGPISVNGSVVLDPGTFHLLYLAHKFPLQQQFHGDTLMSKKSSAFAEVMVLQWDLHVSTNSCTTSPNKLSQDKLESNYQNGFGVKRCKTYQSCVDKRVCCNFEESRKRSHGQSSNFLSFPQKTRCVDKLSNPCHVQVPCKITGREIHGQSMSCHAPGVLFVTQSDVSCDMLCSKSSRKVLLEFNAESFFKYKLLQIGGIYAMKHCPGKCFCDPHHINLGIAMITSNTNLRSVSFHFSEAIDCMSGPCNDPSSASCCTSEDSSRFHLHNELILSPCRSADYRTSDVILHVGADAYGLLDVDIGLQALKELVMNLSQRSADTCNSGQQVGRGNTLVGFFEKQEVYSGNGLPEGNLISIQGTVVSLQISDSLSIDRAPRNRNVQNVLQPRYYEEKEGPIYMQVMRDDHMVEIGGRLSKFNSPLGLGPGAFVTFHRILVYSGKKCLMLSPVSSITVNSVREIPSPSMNSLFPSPEENIVSCLMSDLVQIEMFQPRRFRCSIVAIYFVMLERNKDLDKLFSYSRSGTPVVNISLAGFILDDGSSQCCCWTNGEIAARFLRFNEESPQKRSGSSWWRLKSAVRGRTFSTHNQLRRMLARHERICVKNYGSLHESSCQDLQLSGGSEEIFGNQDENLLKSVMLNACSGTLWNVVGEVMSFDAVSMLEKKLQEEHMIMHALQNVWVNEVDQVNPLAEAKALLRDL